jgi:hypothetical protein
MPSSSVPACFSCTSAVGAMPYCPSKKIFFFSFPKQNFPDLF